MKHSEDIKELSTLVALSVAEATKMTKNNSKEDNLESEYDNKA